MSRLVLRGLSKAYGKVRVVDSIDLALTEGEFVSLLGPARAREQARISGRSAARVWQQLQAIQR